MPPRKIQQWYTAAQLARILAHVRAQARKLNSHRARSDELMIEILVACALRRQELCDLSLRDLPMYHGKPEIHVRCGKGGKSRVVPCPEHLQALLKAYVDEVRSRDHDVLDEDSPLFVGRTHQGVAGRRITGRSVRQIVVRIGRDCGFTGAMALSPHAFRRSAATLHLDVGGSLTATQHLLGHAHAQTTDHYLGSDRAQTQAIAEAASAALEQAIQQIEEPKP